MPQRKVLMLASTAEYGPIIPLPKNFEVEYEGADGVDGVFMIDLVEDNLYRVHRIEGKLPLSVYANY